MKDVSYSNKKVYRASDDASGKRVSDKDRGYSAITSGVYFGLDPDAIRGYGKYLHEYTVNARKVLQVKGDREIDKVKTEAKEWGQSKIEELSDLPFNSETISLMNSYSSTEDVTRLYLEEQGYSGIEYLKSGPQDHHDQFVLFRASDIKKVDTLKEAKIVSFKDFVERNK